MRHGMFDRPHSPQLSLFLLKMSAGPSSEEGKAEAEAKAPSPPVLCTLPSRV